MTKVTLTLALGGLLTVGCLGGKKAETPSDQPASHDAASSKGEKPAENEPAAESLDPLERLEHEVADLEKDNQQLRQSLEAEKAARASLEERYAALEIELASSVEEVLRSKASLRGVQNRALAISRIAEVRVQLQSVPQAKDPEVAARLERANDFLARADTALVDGNFGGASYLAERAGDLVRQAGTVAEVRSSSVSSEEELIPIVPPRSLETLVTANLREAPGTDKPRVGQVAKGTELTAVARWGEWFQVETDSGTRVWIHGSVVR
jgi:Bacterial SH3 domain